MARILDYPAVKQINSREWELLEDLEYHVGSEVSTDVITVPKGYHTDFASVPKVFWAVLPPFGRYSPAAVIHDYLYGLQGVLPHLHYSRKRCDQIFLEAMKVMEVGWITRTMMFQALRLFGLVAWNRKH